MNPLVEHYSTFLVWDSESMPHRGEWRLVLWQSFGDANDTDVYSIPRLVEARADYLRSSFLAWVHDLGEARSRSTRLVDHLAIRPGFSYWWMTRMAHKANAFGSGWIVNAVKMLAIEHLVLQHAPLEIILASADKTLARVFKCWCTKSGIQFKWQKLHRQRPSGPAMKRLYHMLPHPMQAMVVFIRYLLKNWKLKNIGTGEIIESNSNITFCSYLLNLDKATLNGGSFKCHYWNNLVSVIKREMAGANWIHKYIKHADLPNARHAGKLINKLNRKSAGRQCHTTIAAGLNIQVIVRAVFDYGRIALKTFMVRKKLKCSFKAAGSEIDLWPFFQHDWKTSMHGANTILNCLDLNLSEYILGRMNNQRLGFYLQENQPWERAFIYAWKSAGHGAIIGVPHTTVAYWDLRHFFDPRSYQRNGKNNLPLPDKVAFNGPVPRTEYQKGGYPENQMVEVEALRYLYLCDFKIIKFETTGQKMGPHKILVLGDYSPHVTRRQLSWLHDSMHIFGENTRFLFKPHPACTLDPKDCCSLEMNISRETLAVLLADCNVVYTSNITSAAIDAFCAGVPVVSMLDGETLNMSPLRGLEGVTYVTNANDLANALKNSKKKRNYYQPYFFLDKELPRWRKLLADTNI